MTSTDLPQPARPPHGPDDALLEALADVFDQVDGPPAYVDEAARAAFTVRDLDAELMPLLEREGLTAVRGDVDHWFTFAVDGLEVEVGARRARRGWDLVGQVTGLVSGLEVQTMTGVEPVGVDDFGRFSTVIGARTLRLRMLTPEGRRLRTDWVTL